MAYNGIFPTGYQPAYPQQFNGGQQTYPNPVPGTTGMGMGMGQQLMTPPTIHAEIVQVSGRDEAANWPVGAGQSQMMIARDDSAIYIKTVYANGQAGLIEYLRSQPKAEPTPDYVTREELEERLAELMKPKTKAKKEAVQDEQGV